MLQYCSQFYYFLIIIRVITNHQIDKLFKLFFLSLNISFTILLFLNNNTITSLI